MLFSSLLFLLAVVRLAPWAIFTPLYQLRPAVLILAFPSFVAAAWTSDHVSAALTLVAALVWLREFGGRVRSGSRGRTSTDEASIRCINLNTGDHRSKPEEIARYLSSAPFDIVCLQETAQSHLDIFESELAELFPFREYHDTGVAGLAILSRFPLANPTLLRFRGRLPHLMVEALINGRVTRVINAHPFVTIALFGEGSSPAHDVREIASIASEGPPTLVMGDFNTTDQTRAYRTMKERGLVDAFAACNGGFGSTFPIPMRFMWIPCPPIVRIDFLWHTSHFEATTSVVGPDASSDHLPLETGLRWVDAVAQLRTEDHRGEAPAAPLPGESSEKARRAAAQAQHDAA